MGKRYDAERVYAAIEDLGTDLDQYRDRARTLEFGFGRYYRNETYIGRAADASKEFIDKGQMKKLHDVNLEIQSELYKRCANTYEVFKEMVDPSPKARIDTDVLLDLDKIFRRFGDGISDVGYEIECVTREVANEFGEYADFYPVTYNAVRYAHDELCGHGGHFEKCINKIEEFDEYVSSSIRNYGLLEADNELQSKLLCLMSSLDAMKVFEPSVAKNSIELVAVGASIAAEAAKKSIDKKELDTKVDRWLSPDYKMTDAEIAEAEGIIDRELSWVEYNNLGEPIFRSKEEEELYWRYIALANKCSPVKSFAASFLYPLTSATEFVFDNVSYVLDKAGTAAANTVDSHFGTNTIKVINIFEKAYEESAESFFDRVREGNANAKIQHPTANKVGNISATAVLYYATSGIFGKVAPALGAKGPAKFVADQAVQSIQDIIIDTRAVYQELIRDGDLSASDWATLGWNVAENAIFNLGFGAFSEYVKPAKAVELEKIAKGVEDIGDAGKAGKEAVEDLAEGVAKKASSVEKYIEEIVDETGKASTEKLHELRRAAQRGTFSFDEISEIGKKITDLGITEEYDDVMKKMNFGEYLKKMIGSPPEKMIFPHAHHILYKTGNGEAQQQLVKEGQAILREYGIDPILGLENLVWAPYKIKGQHSIKSLEKIVGGLRAVYEMGGDCEDIVEVLVKMGREASTLG